MGKASASLLRWNADDGIINYCNSPFSQKCDKAPRDIIGKHISELQNDNELELKNINNLKLVPGQMQTDTLSWKSKDGAKHTELTAVHAISQDGTTVSEIQIETLGDQDEYRFRSALDSLLDTISNNDSNTQERISSLLNIGVTYFELQSGIVGSAMGNSLELISVTGDIANFVTPSQKLPIHGSFCNEVLNNDETVALHSIEQSNQAELCFGTPLTVRSYIGTQVLSTNGPLGVLAFFSESVRAQGFTVQDKKFIGLIASWIGAVLGNEEQLEFLSLQNDYYQSLFQTVPTMLMLCNQDGLILSTSNRLSDKLGQDALSIPGRNCRSLFLPEFSNTVQNALQTGNVDHLPLTMLIGDDKTLEVELNSSIKHIGSMQGVRMIVLADVSERNQAIRAAEEKNKQLGLINESLNQFAFIASHDLQEPLRKIQQFSQFLAEDLGDRMNEDSQYHLDVIVNSATRMSTLIQDLLTFSSAAKGEVKSIDIDMNQLLRDVQNELELRIQESNAHIHVENLPVVAGDLSLVRQLFINLVSNSIKYRDPKQAPVIKVATEYQNDSLCITVTDNGIGFDQAHASRAFEPFSRLHKDKQYSGNGIGLSICATVCEKHDWSLSVQSEPDKGSVFTINLGVSSTSSS